MNWLLKIAASQGVKLGVAYALKIIVVTIAALRGVLNDGAINDEARNSIASVVRVLISVRDFVGRLAEIIGAPAMPQAVDGDMRDVADKLDRITDGL